MKKKSIFVAAFFVAVSTAIAMTPTYTDYLVNDPGAAFSTTYEINLNARHVDQLSFQAVYSSAAIPSVTFNNGTISTGSVTVSVNSGFAAVKATDSITVTDNPAVKASNTITVSSNTALSGAYLTINGYKLTEGIEWHLTATSSGTANAIATAIRANAHGITASFASGVVYATAAAAGNIGNGYTMTSSTPAALAVGTANFTGGAQPSLENAILTFNGKAYRNGYEWKSGGTGSATATNLAAFLNTFPVVRAASVSNVVYATATTQGSAGNAFTLVCSTPALTFASGNFTGGSDSATVTINGTSVLYGTDWSAGTTSSATAKSISDAIMANGTLNAIISSTWNASAVVTLTALTAGPNYSISALPVASFATSGANMTGGAASGINTTAETITIASHGLTTGLAILFSTSSASTPPAPLINQTTYYAIKVDANTIKIATTSALAVLGTSLNLTSQGTANKSFSLAPLALTGTASFKWQLSNDDTNWVDSTLAGSSVTFASPYTAGNVYSDFGQINANYIRLNYTAPTTGAVNLKVKGNGKSSNP